MVLYCSEKHKQTLIEQKQKDDVTHTQTYDSMVFVVVKNEH